MAKSLRGAPIAAAITEELAGRVDVLRAGGVAPTLAIVRVGERPDDLSYERGACKRAEKIGVDVKSFVLAEDCSQQDLLEVIEEVNCDPSIHGCLILRPLPAAFDEAAVCTALDPAKDVDGITVESLYGVFANKPLGYPPCTAEAVVELLARSGIELSGAHVTVVGRSLVIGRPVSMMLQAKNATVTMCHTRTRDLAAECRAADVLVVAAGHARTVGAGSVTAGQTVVDVGFNWDDVDGKLVGDVEFDAVEPVVDAITPVPGGVGSVTTAILVKHVVEAAERAKR
ncbi:bifunctional 5,10-methylenetetrahydrofolate dehydrogenase/5,10-methenyltetrahydrofolate cyclohydrolase [Enorma phocaeensis]|uniref:bifunctional 5,10-methylenetetrahydrofolate dehydrogenase/5,10-methenyltetrahydrofolate cyclohydrolase n=1 Tax=Enorma phocaeensis TaxID=1871019 RepID=UPI003207F148